MAFYMVKAVYAVKTKQIDGQYIIKSAVYNEDGKETAEIVFAALVSSNFVTQFGKIKILLMTRENAKESWVTIYSRMNEPY